MAEIPLPGRHDCWTAASASGAAAMTSSHFCSAERQYRTPLEYGSQRTPTAQWTVTGSGCCDPGSGGRRPLYNPCDHGQNCGQGHQGRQQHGCRHGPGRLRDHQGPFSGHRPQALNDYDLIVTGDLGKLGYEIVSGPVPPKDGIELRPFCRLRHADLRPGGPRRALRRLRLRLLRRGAHRVSAQRHARPARWKNILFCGTGALLSPTSSQQGESIPCICHAVSISVNK